MRSRDGTDLELIPAVARRRALWADPLTPVQRRHNMQKIGARNTKPELLLRRSIHAAGLRYRLHGQGLPGRPDLVFPKWRAVIFVHGCFWHGHDCSKAVQPRTNPVFWEEKFEKNQLRDRRQAEALKELGWRVGTVWECALTGRLRLPTGRVTEELGAWLKSERVSIEIAGGRQ